jgi:integral membrane protein
MEHFCPPEHEKARSISYMERAFRMLPARNASSGVRHAQQWVAWSIPRDPGERTPAASTTLGTVPAPSAPATPPAVARWLLVTYRVFAYVTGVLLAVNTIFLVVLREVEQKPEWYAVSWTLHGWAYMFYLASGFAIAFTMRWGIIRSVLVLLAGTIPFMSFVAERWVVRHVTVADQSTSALRS